MKSFFTILGVTTVVAAQVPAWGRCGGEGYTGQRTCVSGYSCVYVNNWYSQCQPGSTTASESSSTTMSTSAPTGTAGTLRFLGRVNPETRELTWPGTGISFTFVGTSATIHLTEVTGTNSVDIFIDDSQPIVISNVASTSISTPSGLSSGHHTVQLRKRSETLFGTIVVGDVTTDGYMVANPAPAHQIEFVGDSITVGYGLDGTYPCTNTAAVEDNPKTYAAVAANELNADYSVVAWSGKGLVRNYVTATPDTSPTMPELYTRYGANDADNSYTFPSSWMPEVVIINLGTNDFGYILTNASGDPYDARPPLDIATYTNGMVDFVRNIQKHYPMAEFILMSSPMLSDYYPTTGAPQHTTESNALKSAVAQIGSNAHFVDWPTQGSAVGCDYHPIASTHAAEGAVLASAIKTILGW